MHRKVRSILLSLSHFLLCVAHTFRFNGNYFVTTYVYLSCGCVYTQFHFIGQKGNKSLVESLYNFFSSISLEAQRKKINAFHYLRAETFLSLACVRLLIDRSER